MLRGFLALTLLVVAAPVSAQWICGTGPATERHVSAARGRKARMPMADATPGTRTISVRDDGTFLVPNDATLTSGSRPFDLAGQSLVFEPSGEGFTTRRTALQYVEPSNERVIDFGTSSETYIARELGFAFPIFGRSVTRIYVSAFNGITFEEPVPETALQFDDLDAAVHRSAIVSPLLLTTHIPAELPKPRVFIDAGPDAVVVTWRSSGDVFGYNVQARLASSGAVTFSYENVEMRWGAPIITAGFDPKTATRTVGYTLTDTAGVTTEVQEAIRPMVDLRKIEIVTFDDSELFAVRLTMEGAIDPTKLEEGREFGVLVALADSIAVEDSVAAIEFTRNEVRIQGFGAMQFESTSARVMVDGNVIEFYGLRNIGAAATGMVTIGAATYQHPYAFYVDQAGDYGRMPYAKRAISTDLSSVGDAGVAKSGLITEAFTLGVFDPAAVWARLQKEYGLSDEEYDGVAMYQNFYTDLIFYAGAYATLGNPQVDGITGEGVDGYGRGLPRAPTLMHMNHLTYNQSSSEKSASRVMLHEFGHRWLYFLEVELPLEPDRVLNPVSAHPAAYVHTPSAFSLHGPNEASVMGGGYFTSVGSNTWKAQAANYGYSWTDLYAMGLADAVEVTPWFFLKGTNLPKQYFPEDGITVTGTRKDVNLNHVRNQLGFRQPSAAYSDRNFRVLFVLVTEEGRPASEAEIATMRKWRSVLERDFTKATGGRGRVKTSFHRPTKHRAAN